MRKKERELKPRYRASKKSAPKIVHDQKPKPFARIPDIAGAQSRSLMPRMAYDQLIAATRPAQPPAGVVPKGYKSPKMAMDSAFQSMPTWMAESVSNYAFVEGYTFLGYPYLAQLAQIPEYRLISETIAQESTRKWIKIKSKSEDVEMSDSIQELEEEMKKLCVRDVFKQLSEQDGFFGRAHLYLDTGNTDEREELITPLGSGDKFSTKKFKKGFLKALRVIEPIWTYPSRYDAADPLAANWYRPECWFVNGKELHRTRLLTFVARPVPDIFKPAFSFGGLAMSQMAKPYVDNWLQTRQSVNDIVHSFSVMVLKTSLEGLLQEGGDNLDKRIRLFVNYRDNKAVMALDKNNEDFQNVSAPLGSLDKLQAQAQEHMAAVSRIPLVKLTGITPSGLNASSDGEIRTFYDTIHAYQEAFFGQHLLTVFKLCQINLWGKINPDLVFEYEPLWELDEKTLADLRKTEADTDKTLIDAGVLDPSEPRQRIADDPDQPYGPIDPEDVPEPMGPEPGEIHERIDDGEGGENDEDEDAPPNPAQRRDRSNIPKKVEKVD